MSSKRSGTNTARAHEGGALPRRAAPPAVGQRLEVLLLRLFEHPRLPLILVAIALALASPALLLGFYIDDWVGLFIYNDALEGARELFRIYNGGYGIANGDPADTHFQIEQGYAPWWTYEHLRIRMLRPIGELLHHFDMLFWPTSAFAMHAHNLAWLAALVLAATRLFRGALGPKAGGLAALLFALDHTRGFAVGFIVNRHALIVATFGLLALDQYLRARMHGDKRARLYGPLVYALALASGEAAIAAFAYMAAFALLADRAKLRARALALAPYFALSMVWAAVYSRGGYGASGSGLYLDPGHEPLYFLLTFLERGPVLVLGLFLAPPAEVWMIAPQPFGDLILALAVLFSAAFAFALVPLLARDRLARFWTLGLVCALVPASSAFPHNRQLLFASFAGMALIAQLWHFYAIELKNVVRGRIQFASRAIAALPLTMHLFGSPLLAPITVCSVALLAPLQRPLADEGEDIPGRDVVFVNAPDYLAVRHVQIERRVERMPLARRWRALAFGPERITLERIDERTLELHYEGGILSTPFTQLFRDRRLPMKVGQRVELEGLMIEVREVTADGRVERARFTFDEDLDAPSFLFYAHVEGRFERYTLPPSGGRDVLEPALLEWTFR
jgi:hypothetical protein